MELNEFLKERDEALANLDLNWARKMFSNASCDFVRLIAMHKARYECTILSPELRHESGDWLRKKGMYRMSGEPLLVEGTLPS